VLVDGHFQKLCLATIAVGRYHESASHLVGDRRTVIAAHKVQAEIQACGTSR